MVGLTDIALETDTASLFKDSAQRQCFSESLKDYSSPFFEKEASFGSAYSQHQQSVTIGFLEQLLSKQKNGFTVVIVVQNEAEQQRLQEIITQANTLKGLHPVYFHGELYNGFCYSLAEKAAQETMPLLDWPLIKKKKDVVVVPGHEIFGRRSNRPLGKSRSSSQAKAHQVD